MKALTPYFAIPEQNNFAHIHTCTCCKLQPNAPLQCAAYLYVCVCFHHHHDLLTSLRDLPLEDFSMAKPPRALAFAIRLEHHSGGDLQMHVLHLLAFVQDGWSLV